MFEGLWTALVTPFNGAGEVDYAALENILRLQEQAGIQGVVLCSSTGEGMLLEERERDEIIRFTKKIASSSFQILVGCSQSSTRRATDMAVQLEQLGVDGLLVTAPYYVKPSPAGVIKYFETVAESTKLPIVVYNIPSRVGVNLTHETILELTKLPNIKALKESVPDFQKVSALSCAAPGLTILSGDDATLPACIAHGARGAISAAANAWPGVMRRVLCREESASLRRQVSLISSILSLDSNPVPIKYVLERKGLIKGGVRAPLLPLTQEKASKLDEFLNDLEI